MLEGAKAAGWRGSRRGKTEGAPPKKISIRHLGRGFHFTAGRGLFSPGSDVVPAPALHIPLRELVSGRQGAGAKRETRALDDARYTSPSASSPKVRTSPTSPTSQLRWPAGWPPV